MAKFRPIDVRLWNDRKFLSLSDDGRLLWTFLLTTPRALPIPGVIIGGPAALAEQLQWSVERFEERFREVQQSGLAVSREGTLVWLRNATKYQPPSNPNMVIGWSKVWDDVPETDLKHELWQALKIACKGWSRIFDKRFHEPSLNGSANGFTHKHKQEQEHKQEHKHDQEHDLVPLIADTKQDRPVDELKRKVDRATPKLPRKHPLPSDWEPRAAERELAVTLGVDCAVAAERFRDHHLAKGNRWVDWDSAFRNWLRNAKEFGQGRKPARTPLEQQLERVRMLEEQERQEASRDQG